MNVVDSCGSQTHLIFLQHTTGNIRAIPMKLVLIYIDYRRHASIYLSIILLLLIELLNNV